MIEELTAGIWTVTTPFKLAGADFGARMTIVRVGENGLLLISPCSIDDALAAELEALGTVRALVAPNAFHHLFIPDAAKRYPQAACFLADGVEKKIGADAAGASNLTATPDPIWKAELDQCLVEGAPAINEVVFYHAASRTLILTDLCFNFDPAPTGYSGFVVRLMGAHGRLTPSRLMRFLLKDRVKVRASVERILEWDFERIVVTHGSIIDRDGRRRFREATVDL